MSFQVVDPRTGLDEGGVAVVLGHVDRAPVGATVTPRPEHQLRGGALA